MSVLHIIINVGHCTFTHPTTLYK